MGKHDELPAEKRVVGVDTVQQRGSNEMITLN